MLGGGRGGDLAAVNEPDVAKVHAVGPAPDSHPGHIGPRHPRGESGHHILGWRTNSNDDILLKLFQKDKANFGWFYKIWRS